jgi:hypothetical protein
MGRAIRDQVVNARFARDVRSAASRSPPTITSPVVCLAIVTIACRSGARIFGRLHARIHDMPVVNRRVGPDRALSVAGAPVRDYEAAADPLGHDDDVLASVVSPGLTARAFSAGTTWSRAASMRLGSPAMKFFRSRCAPCNLRGVVQPLDDVRGGSAIVGQMNVEQRLEAAS